MEEEAEQADDNCSADTEVNSPQTATAEATTSAALVPAVFYIIAGIAT